MSETKEVGIRPTNQHKFDQNEKVTAFGTVVYELDIKIAGLNFRFPVFKMHIMHDRK